MTTQFLKENPGEAVTRSLASTISGLGKNLVGGPLAALHTKKYGVGVMLQYPLDLGSGPFVSWVMFRRLESTGRPAGAFPDDGAANKALGSGGMGPATAILNNLGSGAGSTLDSIGETLGFGKDSFTKLGITKNIGLSAGRAVRTTSDSIALYMPNQMVFGQSSQYTEASLTQQIGSALRIAQGSQNLSDVNSKDKATQADGQAGLTRQAAESIASATGLNPYQISGVALNPQLEVLFTQTDLRTFQFEFVFGATSPAEAGAIKNIIRSFRLWGAPKIAGNDGRYLIPPDEFDIEFFFKDAENLNIPKISTCVLTNIIADLAPSGAWSTFTDGKPISTRLTLQFKEVELIHKGRVEAGY